MSLIERTLHDRLRGATHDPLDAHPVPGHLAWTISRLVEVLREDADSGSDPFLLASACGIEVTLTQLQFGPGLATRGTSAPQYPLGRILVDQDLNAYERRLVCGHELGHHVLQLDSWLSGWGPFPTNDDEQALFEALCDTFSLAVLVPLSLVDQLGQIATADELLTLSISYSVPCRLLATRVRQLGLDLPYTFAVLERAHEAGGDGKVPWVVAEASSVRFPAGEQIAFVIREDGESGDLDLRVEDESCFLSYDSSEGGDQVLLYSRMVETAEASIASLPGQRTTPPTSASSSARF